MKKSIATALLLSLSCVLKAQEYQWAKGIGSHNSWLEGVELNGLTLDLNGDIIIVGSLYRDADFDPGSDSTILTAIGYPSIFFAKYNANGSLLWVKQIASENKINAALSVKTDANGNIYIGGYFTDSVDFDPEPGTHILTPNVPGNNQDAFIAKYDNNGNYLWAIGMGGLSTDRIFSIELDNNGNVYTAGYFNLTVDFDPGSGVATLTAQLPSSGQSNLFFAKYSSNGNYLWANSLKSSSESIDVTSDGTNLYITGNFTDTVDFDPSNSTAELIGNAALNIFFAKYDANGNYVYAKHVQHASAITSYGSPGRGVKVDANGNLFLTGRFSSFNGTDFDPGTGTALLNNSGSSMSVYLAKYNAAGDYVWAHKIDGDSDVNSFTFDNNGNLLLAGIYHSATVDFDFGAGVVNLPLYPHQTYFARYDTDGDYVDAKCFGGSAYDYVYGMEVNSSNELYCGGLFTSDSTDFDPSSGAAILNKTNSTLASNAFIAKYSLSAISSTTEVYGDNVSLQIFPNPSSGLFLIKTSTDQPFDFRVTDLTGNILASGIVNQNNYTLNLTDIASGMYMISLLDKTYKIHKH